MKTTNRVTTRCGRAHLGVVVMAGAGLAVAGLLASALVQAEGGIRDEDQSPHFASNVSKDDFEDLSVKVRGGEVKMLRRWTGDHWEWNTRWSDLVIYDYKGNPWPTDYPVVMRVSSSTGGGGSSASLSMDPCTLVGERPSGENPFFIERNGQLYVQKLNAIGCIVSDEFFNTEKRWFSYDDDSGFTWHDRLGNRIQYDSKGRMQYYEDNNGVRVSLQRECEVDDTSSPPLWKMDCIKDDEDNIVIKMVKERYELSPSNYAYRTTWLLDCARLSSCHTTAHNRAVTYHYDDDKQLVAISDVLNPYDGSSFNPISTTRANWDNDSHNGWWYDYSSGKLIAYYDPLGRKTTLSIDKDGVLRSKFNSDGVGAAYSYRYDKEKKQYYISKRDGQGVVTETWYHDLGGIMRQDVNGETEFSSEIILSDNGDDTKVISDRFSILGSLRKSSTP